VVPRSAAVLDRHVLPHGTVFSIPQPKAMGDGWTIPTDPFVLALSDVRSVELVDANTGQRIEA